MSEEERKLIKAEKRKVIEQLQVRHDQLLNEITSIDREIDESLKLDEEEKRLKKEIWKMERGHLPSDPIETPYDDDPDNPEDDA